jgi:hypothetical protein
VSNHPAPRRKDHLRFVRIEGWTEVCNAVGQSVRHHPTFEFSLPDGSILRTHISRPPDSKETYGPGLWGRILRDQLRVTTEEFWACVHDGTPPDRGAVTPPADTIPADVLTILINRGVPEDAALAMTREAALARMYELLAQPVKRRPTGEG